MVGLYDGCVDIAAARCSVAPQTDQVVVDTACRIEAGWWPEDVPVVYLVYPVLSEESLVCVVCDPGLPLSPLDTSLVVVCHDVALDRALKLRYPSARFTEYPGTGYAG